jgi:hypothetical protein
MPRHFLSAAIGMVALCATGSIAGAQGIPVTRPAPKIEIPTSSRPPSGMCRVWIDKIPAGQQPAPTDCASAIRNRPPNGRVIFSEQQHQLEERRMGDRAVEARRSPDSAARRPDTGKAKREAPPKQKKPGPPDRS